MSEPTKRDIKFAAISVIWRFLATVWVIIAVVVLAHFFHVKPFTPEGDRAFAGMCSWGAIGWGLWMVKVIWS